MDISIRQATPADAFALARLRYEFRASPGGALEREDEFVERCVVVMAGRLNDEGRWRCWVVEGGGLIVGNVWLQLIEKIPNPTPERERHSYLTNFFVRESERGRGVGSMLLEAALGCCEAEDVHAVILWPTQRSRPLYLRHGFRPPADMVEFYVDAPEAVLEQPADSFE